MQHDGYPRLTGRTRHRVQTYWGRETLILQVEVEGWNYDPGYACLTKWWRDARTSDVTVVPANAT